MSVDEAVAKLLNDLADEAVLARRHVANQKFESADDSLTYLVRALRGIADELSTDHPDV
jgi:hypothetical protein